MSKSHLNFGTFGIPSEWVRTCIVLLLIAGCRQGPARIQPPDISPSRAGRMAMDEYDTNGDGAVAGEELERAPSLKAALATLDKDSDGRVTADEVAERVRAWQKFETGLTTFTCRVELDGRPLSGAHLTFEPEPFLGEELQAAVGTTNRFGATSPIIPKEERPTPETPPGLAVGLYKIRISKVVNGSELIPSRYNRETILGQQVSLDDPAMLHQGAVFRLTSKP